MNKTMAASFAPKISVLMSCYNSEKYLDEAITSILNQDYENFEFIIINDGSTDNTLKIISRYLETDKRIRLLSHENIGLTKSLNKGIDIATGEFVARMDADDISLPQRFSSFIKYLSMFPDVQLYSTPAILINGSGRSESVIPNFFRRKFFDPKMLDYYCSLTHGTLIVRTTILKKLKYNEDFICSQDDELYSRAIESGFKISYDANNVGYKFRDHDSNISKTKYSTSIGGYKRVLALRGKKYYEPTLINRIWFLTVDAWLFIKYKFGIN